MLTVPKYIYSESSQNTDQFSLGDSKTARTSVTDADTNERSEDDGDHGDEHKDDDEGRTTLDECDADSENPDKREKRRFRFGNVQVFEFSTEIGDNPSVGGGCPITIGWTHVSERVYTIDEYEALRPSNERRQRRHLRLSSKRRTRILLRQGHDAEEISDAILRANAVKGQREHSRGDNDRHRHLDSLYEALVLTGRRLKQAATSKSQLQQQEQSSPRYASTAPTMTRPKQPASTGNTGTPRTPSSNQLTHFRDSPLLLSSFNAAVSA